jgi:hypothetical protein
MNAVQRVAIRVDAFIAMGIGHLMRCARGRSYLVFGGTFYANCAPAEFRNSAESPATVDNEDLSSLLEYGAPGLSASGTVGKERRGGPRDATPSPQ